MKQIKLFLPILYMLLIVGSINVYSVEYSYKGEGTFTKQDAVDGDGYYVFILTPGTLTNSASSDYITANTDYKGSETSLTNVPITSVLRVANYAASCYNILNNSDNYLYSSANKKITYSATSKSTWTTGDCKLKTTGTTVVYMGCVSSKFRPYSSSTTNATSFVCVYKLNESGIKKPTLYLIPKFGKNKGLE